MQPFRLLPTRKLPKLPEKGERWAGLLRPSTLIFAGIAVVLVATVWIGVATVRPSTPSTLDAVTDEVTTQVDELIATLPAAPLATTDDSVVAECPDGSAEQQYQLERVLTVSGLDPAAWAAQARESFEQKQWRVTTDRYGDQGGLTMSMLGMNLVPIDVTVSPDADSTRITVRSDSRCTGSADRV